MSFLSEEETQERIKKHLLGKEIEGVDGGNTLILADGTKLYLYESEQDCCAGAYGKWDLPDDFHGGITDVEFRRQTGETDWGEGYEVCSIAILHNQAQLAIADGYADSGNGDYYFSVLSLGVFVERSKIDDFPLLDTRQ